MHTESVHQSLRYSDAKSALSTAMMGHNSAIETTSSVHRGTMLQLRGKRAGRNPSIWPCRVEPRPAAEVSGYIGGMDMGIGMHGSQRLVRS